MNATGNGQSFPGSPTNRGSARMRSYARHIRKLLRLLLRAQPRSILVSYPELIFKFQISKFEVHTISDLKFQISNLKSADARPKKQFHIFLAKFHIVTIIVTVWQ
ncbi:MAG TPA: hypothetical protein VG754_10970 [Verrucomicrobiae bacterium]|nr:hypothetical protein [Verrucomicrobiae bacterium]